jgi:hypothetical protein
MGHHLLATLVPARGLDRMRRILAEHGGHQRSYSAGSVGLGRKRP